MFRSSAFTMNDGERHHPVSAAVILWACMSLIIAGLDRPLSSRLAMNAIICLDPAKARYLVLPR